MTPGGRDPEARPGRTVPVRLPLLRRGDPDTSRRSRLGLLSSARDRGSVRHRNYDHCAASPLVSRAERRRARGFLAKRDGTSHHHRRQELRLWTCRIVTDHPIRLSTWERWRDTPSRIHRHASPVASVGCESPCCRAGRIRANPPKGPLRAQGPGLINGFSLEGKSGF